MIETTTVTVNKKNGKSPQEANRPASPADTASGVPNAPPYSPLDLDMEELSGSLLVDEPLGRGALIVTRTPSPKGFAPFAPAASYPPPPRAPVQLPKPNPPPKHDPVARASETKPQPVDSDAATTENLPTVDLRELASTYELLSPQPPPAAQPPEPELTVRLPPAAPLSGDVELTTLPRGMRSPLLSAFRNGLRRASGMLPSRDWSLERRRGWALTAMVLAGLVAGVGLAVSVVGALREHAAATPIPSSVTPTALVTVPAAVLPVVPSRPPAPSPSPAACTRTGEPHVIAPKATVTAGIEIRTFGGDVALGFAPNDHQAMIVRLDPGSLAAVESRVAVSADPIRRVTPIPGKRGRLGLAVDVDRKGDRLHGRRTLPTDPPIQVGVADSYLAWAIPNRAAAGKLWPLERDEAVEALRGARSESNLSMVAIAFRQAGAVWVGAAEGSDALVPKGALFRVGGLGPMVGFPAVAVDDGVGLVAWADRSSPDDSWRLRWVRFKLGEAPGEPAIFTPPSGGNGEQAMSPGLAVVPGGRFLLTWTQGPTSVHEVRALTFSGEGGPEGAPLNISSVGVNAGQGQAAVTASGRGLVAFLESSGNGFQVVATPITCVP